MFVGLFDDYQSEEFMVNRLLFFKCYDCMMFLCILANVCVETVSSLVVSVGLDEVLTCTWLVLYGWMSCCWVNDKYLSSRKNAFQIHSQQPILEPCRTKTRLNMKCLRNMTDWKPQTMRSLLDSLDILQWNFKMFCEAVFHCRTSKLCLVKERWPKIRPKPQNMQIRGKFHGLIIAGGCEQPYCSDEARLCSKI